MRAATALLTFPEEGDWQQSTAWSGGRAYIDIERCAVRLTIRPLTPDLWPALETLFGKNGACNGYWCMYWPLGATYRKRSRNANKAAFRNIVNCGPPPGLLAFDGNIAVGWCQLTPRDALPWLNESWRLKRVDEVPVWALSCFYIRIGYRRRDVTAALIRAALKEANRAQAPALEAYPLGATKAPSTSSTGYASTFARAGFRIVTCRGHWIPRSSRSRRSRYGRTQPRRGHASMRNCPARQPPPAG